MASLLNDDSDSEVEIRINKDYAEKYDNWRRKEELQKLKDRYGEEVDTLHHSGSDSSTSEDEDENPEQLSKEFDKQFFQALACVKKKDRRIYDENVHFFSESNSDLKNKKSSLQKKPEKPFLLRDYEREQILKKTEKSNSKDDEDSHESARRPESPTIVQEERAIKESFMQVVASDDDDDNAWGGLFQKRHKTQAEMEKEEQDYKAWLKGQKEKLEDKDTETELKFLRDYWNDPKLDSGEQFLRDYILNERYLEKDNDKDYIPTYEEVVHDSDENLSEDEKTIEQQEEFEHKFNFRFEEPDQEFIKRYPRTVEHSLRRKDERRKRKRQEIRERKEAEKHRKMEELKQLKALKRKEIMEKIEKLKEITGNEELGIKDEDLEGDFDPAEHDRRMQQLFDDSYYNEEEGEQKPEFPDLDEELEIENWNKWSGNNDVDVTNENEVYEPHCEDPDFNMDCEYENVPEQKLQDEIIQAVKGKQKGRKKSKFAQVVAKKKPVFDPKDHTFDQYVEEYYKLDFEDVIGDLPCRFKYRNVVPNSFGLSVEEILKADDRELNRWCSLKKAVQYRPEHIEKYDVHAYERKATNEHLKKKTFQSLYATQLDQNEDVGGADQEQGENATVKKKKKKSKKRKLEESENNLNSVINGSKPKKIKQENDNQSAKGKSMSADYVSDASDKPESKSHAHELPINNVSSAATPLPPTVATDTNVSNKKKNKKKKKHKQNLPGSTHLKVSPAKEKHLNGKYRKKADNKQTYRHGNSFSRQSKPVTNISDARLRAYGINPKKYKNKLKYAKPLN